MQVCRRSLVVGAAAVLCALACAATALASSSMETSLMDDQWLIYSSPAQVRQTMDQIAALGVDRVKVSVVWSLVAPNPDSSQRPNFDATDPNAYPPGAWDRYDLIVKLAQQLGLRVYFQIDPPVPMWAIPADQPQQSKAVGRAPQTNYFEQFVEAVGRRYSGSFGPSTPPQPDPGLLGLLGLTQPGSTGPILPRVSYWGIWNEPDEPQWLNPWYHGNQYTQPSIYRGLVEAAWTGLQASGHSTATDTILVGETANSGVESPGDFVRALYCVGANLKPLTGAAASHFGCPSGSPATFAADNPGLFDATGFAHHPYSFDLPPNRRYPLSGWITMQNLDSLERELNGIFSTYGKLPGGGEVPLYLTEFGYESNPPKPCVNSAAQQATWLNEAEYLAWRDPYVRSWNQFELIDSAPTGSAPGARCSGGFQTGLEFLDGQPKPSFDAFRIPIWLPVQRHGRDVEVWGQLRAANHSQVQYAVVQFEPRGSRTFRQLAEVSTLSTEGFLDVRVTIPSAGLVRLAWPDSSTSTVDYSRSVTVS